MPTDREGARRPAPQSTSLPYLTGALLFLLACWFLVWAFCSRATPEVRRQTAAITQALERISEDYVEDVDLAVLYEGAMQGMVSALEDKYSTYLTSDQLQGVREETTGEYVGIGVRLAPYTQQTVIDEVLPGGPAMEAGVLAGDIITHVDGEDVGELGRGEVVDRVRGEPGTQVVLRISRAGVEEPLDLALTRRLVRAPNVSWRMVGDGIALVHVRMFDQDSAAEVEDALRELQDEGARAVILDLRGNPGGLVGEAIRMSDAFLSEGLVLGLRGRSDVPRPPVEADPEVALAADIPVVVLVNGGTASAAEIVAGGLQGNGRATVVGTRTVGKGSVTSVISLSDRSGLMLTVSRYQLAGGLVIEGTGIEPDVIAGEPPELPVGLSEEEFPEWVREQSARMRQEQLAAALNVLKGEG